MKGTGKKHDCKPYEGSRRGFAMGMQMPKKPSPQAKAGSKK